jgi:aryl-alcohol dehydrogenase-like predicted oxidoreductase
MGLAALGRPAYINVGHRRDLAGDSDVSALERRSLDSAYTAGVRYFDAARSYGRAEEFLASRLDRAGSRPATSRSARNGGYGYTGGWRIDADQHEVKDLSADNLRRQAAESRALLGDHLALYQVHSATLESGVLDDAAVRDELARLREHGLRIGFTVTGPRQRLSRLSQTRSPLPTPRPSAAFAVLPRGRCKTRVAREN